MAGAAFGGAILVALVANPIAYVILAIVGLMGYKIGVSTMALTRPAFGIKGSILPTSLNTIVFRMGCREYVHCSHIDEFHFQ